MKSPSTSASYAYHYVQLRSEYKFSRNVNGKRESRAESFLQIENRRKERHSELTVNKSGEATWFLSPFIRQMKIDTFFFHNYFWKIHVISLNFEESSATNKAHSSVAGIFRIPKQTLEIHMFSCDVSDYGIKR